MTLQATTKLNLFVQRMAESDEQAEWGFTLLLKRDDFEEFFDLLEGAGLFSPDKNLGPVPGDQPGYVRIPYWHALNYLEAVAKLSGERNDIALANKVMEVVRNVSHFRETDGSFRDNYHTSRVFAEILGLVPLEAVADDDLLLTQAWLSSGYERSLAAIELDKGLIKKLLASESAANWQKACVILEYCTVINWADEKEFDGKRKKPVTLVDDYWLHKLITHHASSFGQKTGRNAAEILLARLRELFSVTGTDEICWLSRPAIEEHEQNHSWEEVANLFVEGARDVLLAWVDHEAAGAHDFACSLLTDDSEIVRRIGIHVLNEHWEKLRDCYLRNVGPDLFDDGHLHELYRLLKSRFPEFTKEEKAATVDVIRQIPPPGNTEKSGSYLKSTQRNWLSAIAGKGYEPVDTWYAQLEDDPEIGKLRDFPDFLSYMESGWGPGPSPYSVNELIEFSRNGSLVERLNEFKQTDSWRGPTTRALADMLVEAIKAEPFLFAQNLGQFLGAKRPYQYSIISGLKSAWDALPGDQDLTDWAKVWEALVGFIENLVGDPNFWGETVVEDQDLTPNRDWIPPVIADLLESGTKNDNKAYPRELLPRAWSLIGILLERLAPASEAQEDALTQAINTPKGKAIEALVNHALRACRLSDGDTQSHVDTWLHMEPVFNSELAKCKNSNFEFSALCGMYIANFHYMSKEWLTEQIGAIFPMEYPVNYSCALEGMAYAPASKPVYLLLRDSGVIEWALKNSPAGRHAREKLIERIALAYLWGEEELDQPRFACLFEEGAETDLIELSGFFWGIKRQALNQDQIERVIKFWERCLDWVTKEKVQPTKLLSSLSKLSCYINAITGREASLLFAVAPFVHVNYNADWFVEDLIRLVDIDPATVSALLKKTLESNMPNFDYQDKYKALISKIAQHGLKAEALALANDLRYIDGMQGIFENISRTGSAGTI